MRANTNVAKSRRSEGKSNKLKENCDGACAKVWLCLKKRLSMYSCVRKMWLCSCCEYTKKRFFHVSLDHFFTFCFSVATLFHLIFHEFYTNMNISWNLTTKKQLFLFFAFHRCRKQTWFIALTAAFECGKIKERISDTKREIKSELKREWAKNQKKIRLNNFQGNDKANGFERLHEKIADRMSLGM